MDIQLPDISGVEAMKIIKQKAEEKIPIIALTAYAMKGDEERLLSEGFDGYISKPIDINNLQKTIANLLKGGDRQASEGQKQLLELLTDSR